MVALSFGGFRGKSRKLRILVRKEPNLNRGKATESQSKREDWHCPVVNRIVILCLSSVNIVICSVFMVLFASPKSLYHEYLRTPWIWINTSTSIQFPLKQRSVSMSTPVSTASCCSPCWRPCRRRTGGSGSSRAGPGTSQAPPGFPPLAEQHFIFSPQLAIVTSYLDIVLVGRFRSREVGEGWAGRQWRPSRPGNGCDDRQDEVLPVRGGHIGEGDVVVANAAQTCQDLKGFYIKWLLPWNMKKAAWIPGRRAWQ